MAQDTQPWGVVAWGVGGWGVPQETEYTDADVATMTSWTIGSGVIPIYTDVDLMTPTVWTETNA